MMVMMNKKALLQMILGLRWTELIIVTDHHYHLNIEDSLLTDLYDHEVQHVQVSGKEALSGEWIHDVVRTGEDSWQPLNILMMCSLPCINSAFEQAKHVEEELGTQSAFAMASRWLLIQTVSDDLFSKVPISNVTMDNVVITGERKTSTDRGSIGKFPPCMDSRAYMYTLSYTPTGREWSSLAPAAMVLAEFANVHMAKSAALDFDNTLFPNVKYGFNRRHLTIIVKEWSNYVIRHQGNGVTRWTGLILDLLDVASETLNFTYSLMDATNMSWGTGTLVNPNAGLYGFVHRKEVDIALAATDMTSERYKAMDFAASITFWNVVMVYRRPSDSSNANMPLGPLGKEMALAVAAAMVSVTLCVALFEMCSWCRQGNVWGRCDRMVCWTFCKQFDRALQVVGAALLSEPSHAQVLSWPAKVLLWSWWMLSLVVTAAYGGTLTAFLFINTQPQMFSSPQDLLSKSHGYTWGTIGDSSFQFMFEYSNVSLYQDLWTGMKHFVTSDPDVLSSSISRLVDKVRSEDFVLFFPELTAAAIFGGGCRLEIVDAGIKQSKTSIVLPKGSSLNMPLSKIILDLHSSGLLSLWTEEWFSRTTCPSPHGPRVISLLHMQGVLLLLPVGFALALVVLTLEMVNKRLKRLTLWAFQRSKS